MRKKSKLVRNEAAKYSRLTCNLLPNGCRIDSLEGKEYTVVPMVILTEGVHAGSFGPLYYPKEELSKTPAVWNYKPIVVYHPQMNGEGVSACDPVIINNRKVGVMMNTRWEGSRLKSEAWIDKDRANQVDERIMAAVEAHEMMELSTGVFIDVEDNAGTWKGEDYQGIARNFRPDHLALLPDQIGACSIKDGAGFVRNSAGDFLVVGDPKQTSTWHLRVKRGGIPDHGLMGEAWASLCSNRYQGPKKSEALRKLKALYKSEEMDLPSDDAVVLADNEMSLSNVSAALSSALQEKFPAGAGEIPSVRVSDVYSNFVIYERDGKLWRLGYTASDTKVTLDTGTPTEVVRVTEYRTVAGAFVGNDRKLNINMNKRKLIAILMANAVTTIAGVTLADNLTDEQVNSIKDEDLEKAFNEALKKPTPPANASAAPVAETPPARPNPATNQTPASPEGKVLNLQDYINQAPKGMREVLQNSLSVYNDEKAKLVEVILANKNNGFSKTDLENRPLGELKILARLAATEPTSSPSRTPNFAGQAAVPTGNAEEETPLEIPALNFAKA